MNALGRYRGGMPCRNGVRFGAGAAALCVLLSAYGGPQVERMSLLSNGENVGHVHAEIDGLHVAIDYRVDNNGRGPKIRERLTLSRDGHPVEWTIGGSTLFGAGFEESYRWEAGRAEWSSQADSGAAEAPAPMLYVSADASPWALGLFARVLLEEPDGEADVLPAGRLRLEELHQTTAGPDGVPITFYSLIGVGLNPNVIVLDESGALFAEFRGRDVLIREGFEEEADRLLALAGELGRERLKTLERRLRHEYEWPLKIDNVRIFDPVAGEVGEPTSVLVRDGRIAGVGAGAADSEAEPVAVVDGAGGTLVAGLYDMHTHNTLQSGLYYLAAGITSARDMGNDNGMLADLLAGIASGDLPGPRITPGGLIEARTPFSARTGVVAESLDEALAAVNWYAERGYHEIKTYNSMRVEWVEPIVAEARKAGLGVSGHVPAFMSPDAVIAAGYDSIAHINQLMLGWLLKPGEDTRTALRLTAMKRAADLDLDSEKVRETIQLMRENGTALDTTAVIFERLMISRARQVHAGNAPYLDHVPIGYQRYRRRTFVPLLQPGDDEQYLKAFDKSIEVIGLLHESGVPLLIGTDDATGFTIHRELELYVQAGIPPGETLAIATLGAAKYLNQQDELGSIEPGKLADFLLVAGNPVDDISAMRRVRLVSKGGGIYFPEEIYESLGVRPFEARPEVRLPTDGVP